MLLKSFENKLKKSLFLVIILLSASLIAQSSNIEFESYSTSEGLGSAWDLRPIVQDQYGYLWLVTLDGLIRFDGYEFKSYQHKPNDSTSLVFNLPSTLLVDSKKRFWLVSNFDSIGILSLYNNEMDNFTHFRTFKKSDSTEISFNNFIDLQEDSSGFLWFSSGKKIYCYNPDLRIIKDTLKENKITSHLSSLEKNIELFHIDSNKNFWICSANRIIKYNPVLKVVDLFKLIGENSRIISLYEDNGGVIFFGGTHSCLNVYDPSFNSLIKLPAQSGKFKYLQPPISKGPLYGNDGVTLVKRTTSGNLWIGTVNGGIKIYNKNLKMSKYFSNYYQNSQSSKLSFTSNLFEDNQENLWIPTFNQGLIKVVPSKSIFTLHGNGFGALEDVNSHIIRMIFESKDKTIWVGSSDGFLFSYNPITNKKQLFDEKSININSPTGGDFQSLYEDPDGIIWLATLNGIIKYDPKIGKFNKAFFDINNQLIESMQDIADIVADENDDYLWISTWGDGILKYNRKTLKTTEYLKVVDPQTGSYQNQRHLWSLIKTRSGDIFAGTWGGLSIFDKSTDIFQRYLNLPTVSLIYEDDQNNLWASTREGLFKISPEKEILKHYTKKDGFPSNMIGGILSDDNNILWIATGRGIVRLNPVDESVLVFDEDEGVLLDLFATSTSYFKTQEGLLLYGSQSGTGITAFDPDNIKYNKYPPNVLITDLSVFDTERDTSIYIRNNKRDEKNQIELHYSQNDITFNYVGIHFKKPEQNIYKYKLEPYDKNWRDADVLRSIRYTSLDPGDYLFKVKAANSDGLWSEQFASINVMISPPWWKTLWAYISYIMAGLVFLYIIRSFELKRQQKNASMKESKLRAEAAEFQAKAAEAQSRVIQAENDRKSQELEEARQLQLSMLPKELPKVKNLEIAVYMKTATEVGGDYYDFSNKQDGSLNICLGDATGHGMKAGTLVSMMKSLFVANSINKSLEEFFFSSNEALKNSKLDKMMMAFAMVNIQSDKIVISNAGIPPVYIYRKNSREVEEIKLNGLPLGAMKNTKYEIYEGELLKGDVVLMLSDGFPELQNEKEELYGYERVINSFKNVSHNSPNEIIIYLKEEGVKWVKDKDPDDDVTFVVIKVK